MCALFHIAVHPVFSTEGRSLNGYRLVFFLDSSFMCCGGYAIRRNDHCFYTGWKAYWRFGQQNYWRFRQQSYWFFGQQKWLTKGVFISLLAQRNGTKEKALFQGISDSLSPSLAFIPGRSFTCETDLFRPSNHYSVKNRKTPLFENPPLYVNYYC